MKLTKSKLKEIIREELLKESVELPKLTVPKDIHNYAKEWGEVFKKWGSPYRRFGPSESYEYDWNDQSNYDMVIKEYNAYMAKVAKKLNDAAKPLDAEVYKMFHKILKKYRSKDKGW